METGTPAAGMRVRQVLPAYANSEVHHSLYLPTDWKPGKTWPVIVEYAGNGPYQNKYGDISTGRVEDCKLGYGLTAGQGFIWVCLPYISAGHSENQRQWWGDVEATVDYCKQAVGTVCRDYGGDPKRVVFAGFSRGAIAANFIGLHDDEIASLWCGFFCHSHYDGVRLWPYEGSDRESAARRLARLGKRPQFISQEISTKATQNYLRVAQPEGRYTFLDLPYRNHTDLWLLRDIPERRAAREWLQRVVKPDQP